MLETIGQTAITGLLVGGVYALLSVGLALIFGVMKVINFAQGDFMMLGMYIVFLLTMVFASVTGLAARASSPVLVPLVGALLAGVFFYFVAALLHRGLLGWVAGARRASQDAQLLLTLGLSLVIQNGVLIVVGPTPRSVTTPLMASAWDVGPFFINQAQGVAFILAIVATACLYYFLTHTQVGMSLRAAADLPLAATYVGIDVRRAHQVAFAVGIALTALAGGLVALNRPIHPYIGTEFVVIMFVAVVLGGLGSIAGAFLGGLAIGLVQQLSTLVVPFQLQNVSIFVLFLLVLYLRPRGLLGRSAERT